MAARTRHSLVFRPHEDHIERGKNGLSEFAQPVWRSERPKQTISPKATDSLLCETPCIMTDSRNDLANFADDRVGAASGVYQVVRKDEAELGHQEDLYWKYETFLKVQEANIGALAGAHGSLYAIRKSLYPFPSAGTINDDFVIPSSVLHRGFRIAYEPQAIAYEEAHEMEGFRRRIRITAGNVEQLFQIKGLFWPPRPLVLFCFLSHKAARLVVPLAMIALLVSNVLLWRLPLYHWTLWAQIVFYGLALAGVLGRLRPRVLRLPFYFCMINSSLLVWLYYRIAKHNDLSSSDGKRRRVVWT